MNMTKDGRYILKNGIFKSPMKSWDEFHARVLRLLKEDVYVYRGQSQSFRQGNYKEQNKFDKLSSKLMPSVSRDLNEFVLTEEKYNEYLGSHLAAFRKSIKGRTDILSFLATNDNEAWALGQHYGLKTPLLDFTYSPYVAAFFALINADETKDDHCYVYAISRKFIDLSSEFEIYEPATDHNQRLLNQNGLFVKFNKQIDIEPVIRETVDKECMFVKLDEILIPTKEKEKALMHLESMNITHSTLFPDLHGSSAHANELFRKKLKESTIKSLK